MKTININYSELKGSIEQLEKDYPSRMHWNVDLLRANIKYNLFESLEWDNLVVEIDDENKKALIWWKEIEGDVYALYNTNEEEPTTSEKMYEQIINAEEQAKELWFYEKVFKESDNNNN